MNILWYLGFLGLEIIVGDKDHLNGCAQYSICPPGIHPGIRPTVRIENAEFPQTFSYVKSMCKGICSNRKSRKEYEISHN